MGFATSWLEERAFFPELIKEAPDNDTGIIVVVPAYNEPGITTLLDSLASCNQPECKVEIIIVVNAQPDADDEAILNNTGALRILKAGRKKTNSVSSGFLLFDAGQPPIDGWGVGLARKTGMDEALRRFNSIDKPEELLYALMLIALWKRIILFRSRNDLLK